MMNWTTWIAAMRCWWWCLTHLWGKHAPCEGKAFTSTEDGRRQVDVIAAVTSDWRVLRVFYERTPGLAERRFAEFRDSLYA